MFDAFASAIRSSFSSLADTFTSWVTENKDVSSAISLIYTSPS